MIIMIINNKNNNNNGRHHYHPHVLSAHISVGNLVSKKCYRGKVITTVVVLFDNSCDRFSGKKHFSVNVIH